MRPSAPFESTQSMPIFGRSPGGMLSPFMESLNGGETVIQDERESYYPGRWKNLTKEAFTVTLLSLDTSMIF